MNHPDLLWLVARQRGCDLRVAAHRHRLERYAASFTARRTLGDVLGRVRLPSMTRRRRPHPALVTDPGCGPA